MASLVASVRGLGGGLEWLHCSGRYWHTWMQGLAVCLLLHPKVRQPRSSWALGEQPAGRLLLGSWSFGIAACTPTIPQRFPGADVNVTKQLSVKLSVLIILNHSSKSAGQQCGGRRLLSFGLSVPPFQGVLSADTAGCGDLDRFFLPCGGLAGGLRLGALSSWIAGMSSVRSTTGPACPTHTQAHTASVAKAGRAREGQHVVALEEWQGWNTNSRRESKLCKLRSDPYRWGDGWCTAGFCPLLLNKSASGAQPRSLQKSQAVKKSLGEGKGECPG